MTLKAGMEVAQDYIFFKYGPLITQKYVNNQDRTIVIGPGVNLAPTFFLSGNIDEIVGK